MKLNTEKGVLVGRGRELGVMLTPWGVLNSKAILKSFIDE